ncbi:preprotein translocase subunit [Buchnera aphidicola (Nipponaphis monzeni)]|uniref:Preprotein translocase subunit n=1 Tax=Buchnera aphidicola (Nipponaphis monzeni) TaxID=2495405 RepID=A0A455TAF2_9GAMM|nr:hypothetical protein [Buchnera aphidicola]BBI01299.1 preprotein translocase subunit [Buchnera aphidicola (Nipponaphis monzeni)]
MHLTIFLLFIFINVIFILLVMLQTGKGMGTNSLDYLKNDRSILTSTIFYNNTIIISSITLAIIFFVLNLLLCNIVINERNKSVVLNKNNIFVSSLIKKNVNK